jgi:hypothetical protein
MRQSRAAIDGRSKNDDLAVSPPTTNRVLAALSDADRRRVRPRLARLRLRQGTVLYHSGDEIGHAYCPMNGLVSLVGMTENGGLLQVAAIDADGFVGVPLVLQERVTPHQAIAPARRSRWC